MSSRKMAHKLKNIIKGTYYNITNKYQDLASFRLDICNKCEYRVNTKLGDICDLCGCILESKSRVLDEHCELEKW